MDYALLSTLEGRTYSRLVLSYDIACQWSKNFATRIPDFPRRFHFDPESITFETVIPKFHIYAHGRNCQTTWLLNYRPHMARTDGEGVEREWSHINPVALSTRLMGPGTRHDTLDDHWGAWNWRKLVGLGRHLEFKLKEALVMSSRHRAAFKALSTTFPAETVKEWTEMLERWLVDPSEPDPFEEVTIGKLLSFLIANTADTCISRNYKR